MWPTKHTETGLPNQNYWSKQSTPGSAFSNYVVSITSFVLCIILNLQREFQQGVSVGVPHHVTTRDNPITWGQFLLKLVFQLMVLWKVFASHCILIQIIQEFSASFFKLVFCLFEKNIAFKVQYLMISFWYQSQLAPIAYHFSCEVLFLLQRCYFYLYRIWSNSHRRCSQKTYDLW